MGCAQQKRSLAVGGALPRRVARSCPNRRGLPIQSAARADVATTTMMTSSLRRVRRRARVRQQSLQ